MWKMSPGSCNRKIRRRLNLNPNWTWKLFGWTPWWEILYRSFKEQFMRDLYCFFLTLRGDMTSGTCPAAGSSNLCGMFAGMGVFPFRLNKNRSTWYCLRQQGYGSFVCESKLFCEVFEFRAGKRRNVLFYLLWNAKLGQILLRATGLHFPHLWSWWFAPRGALNKYHVLPPWRICHLQTN